MIVIELETACGCKKLLEINETRPPRYYSVALRRPAKHPGALRNEPVWTATSRDRSFEFHHADYAPTGAIYRYREVVEP